MQSGSSVVFISAVAEISKASRRADARALRWTAFLTSGAPSLRVSVTLTATPDFVEIPSRS